VILTNILGVPSWSSGKGFSIVTAMSQVQSLAQELSHATGLAKKKKKKKEKKNSLSIDDIHYTLYKVLIYALVNNSHGNSPSLT